MQTNSSRLEGPSTGLAGTPGRYTRGPQRLKANSSKSEVSDSEEERQRRIRLKRAALSTVNQNGLRVVVISSDEEDETSLSVIAQKGSQPTQPAADAEVPDAQMRSESETEELPPVTPRRKRVHHVPHARRIVLSSDDEDEDKGLTGPAGQIRTSKAPAGRRIDDVIDLTLSSPESTGEKSHTPSSTDLTAHTKESVKRKTPKARKDARRPAEEPEKFMPLFVEDSGNEDDLEPEDETERDGIHDLFSADDGAILVLDEPRSAQKPIRFPTPSSSLAVPGPSTPGPSKLRLAVSPDSDSEEEVAMIIKPKPTPRQRGVSKAGSTTASPGPSTALASRTPRMSKKAQMQLELERRRAYAQAFFNELNESIFEGGIPANTELQWNKRLLTTAGRAHWRRTRDGVHVTSIQLAEKILDCDERIRNTLSHEMCHLACWIINEDPSENHGALFKRWANKIMRKRPEIEVTTKHNYDIKCKYEWKCANCAKIYGRHSKSINPDEQACGVCKTGKLVPLFETRRAPPRTPKPKADSQNAAVRSRDSPIAMPGAFPPTPAVKVAEITPSRSSDGAFVELFDDGDSDVEVLTHTLGKARIDDEKNPQE